MASIARFQVTLGGFQGAPGVNTIHALDVGQGEPDQTGVDEFSTQLQAMYTALKEYMVKDVTAGIQSEVSVFDVASGELTAILSLSSLWTVVGSSLGNDVSRATMAKFRYRTDRILNNRVVQGGIFYGPVGSQTLTISGGVATAFRDDAITAHDGLLDIAGPMRLAVWAQPSETRPVGEYGYVQSVSVKPLPAVLRSRRD